jgi:Cd2+/Zn2+-exporting ATPase
MCESNKTAVVGDGINDAPALAASHVGIALRGLGNEAAVQAADVVLMGDNLKALPYAIMLSRKTRKIIFQNTVIALATVGILITGAFAGKVGLAAGVLGHEGSALLVILNSMRLLTRIVPQTSLLPNNGDKSKISNESSI